MLKRENSIEMLKLLYIEDDKAHRLIFETVFSQAGYEVTTMNNCESALKDLRKSKYDLIISDILMPITNGLSCAKMLSESDIETPFILTSAELNLHVLNEYRGLNNYLGFILKPITVDKVKELYEQIH